jgi:hypothetical protein
LPIAVTLPLRWTQYHKTAGGPAVCQIYANGELVFSDATSDGSLTLYTNESSIFLPAGTKEIEIDITGNGATGTGFAWSLDLTL